MKWFINLATGTKLIISFGLIMLFMMVIIVQAHHAIKTIQTSQKNLLEEEFTTATYIKDIRSNQNAVRTSLLTMMQITDPSEIERQELNMRKRDQESDYKLELLLANNQHNPKILERLKKFQDIRKKFSDTREDQIIPLLKEGRVNEALGIAQGIQAERNNEMSGVGDELVKISEQAAQAAVLETEEQVESITELFTLIGSFALIFSVAIVFLLNRLISLPLRRITEVAKQIAAGNLTVELTFDNRSDEVGLLTDMFRKMVENLRQVMQEIFEGSNTLASAASEIVATTSQVASGATETASAVTETTATVEEVKKTAELSSEKARYVSDTAQKAAEVSQSGQQAVNQSIEGANEMRQQMATLAESIVQLSEQSQAIGEIIASVNDLAEQSNLLAVNAGIEAAKAGEQGKGFGVVAQEIRTLAEQSKQATGQVRAILSDIQKATSASVLAAEQGSKAVENGVQQTTRTGETIKALAQSITEAAQAATQIAASSQQQQAGMNQIALAIENIREASTQNVTGTKQAESAAHDLSELGQKLKGVIERYQF